MKPAITLMTDFGLEDPYVGIMKGIILSICPEANIIDITHNIPPQDIETAAFYINYYHKFFPEGTIHVIVVDPGVGGKRYPLIVKAANMFFIAPDNGILTFVFNYYPCKIRIIENKKIIRKNISNTFHGRDIFAPAAAFLANGFDFEKTGRIYKSPVVLKNTTCKKYKNKISGKIIAIDHFGNLISNISSEDIKNFNVPLFAIGNIKSIPLVKSYCYADEGSIVAIINSMGLVEIAKVSGNAAKSIGVKKDIKIICYEGENISQI